MFANYLIVRARDRVEMVRQAALAIEQKVLHNRCQGLRLVVVQVVPAGT